jgi:membrane protease YdiL (CAAX protease family)
LEPPYPNPQPGRLYRLGWIVYLVMAVAGTLWICIRERGPIPLGLFVDRREWWLDALLGLGAGVLLLGLWWGAENVSPLARKLQEQLSAILGSLTGSEAFALALLSGFAEELFFRGAVQGQWGWIAATVLFAVLHTGPGRHFRLWTLFAALAGALFGGLMLWRGNLLAPVVAHVLINGVNLRRLARDSGRLPPGSRQSEEEG